MELTTTPVVVTLTATGAVFFPSVKVTVQLPALIGVTVAVYGDVDWVGLTLATPEQVLVSLSVPAKPVSDTVTVCAALAPIEVKVSELEVTTGPFDEFGGTMSPRDGGPHPLQTRRIALTANADAALNPLALICDSRAEK